MSKFGVFALSLFLAVCSATPTARPAAHVRQAFPFTASESQLLPDVITTPTTEDDSIQTTSSVAEVAKVRCSTCGDDTSTDQSVAKHQGRLRHVHTTAVQAAKDVEDSMFTTPPPSPAPDTNKTILDDNSEADNRIPEAASIVLFGLDDAKANTEKYTKLQKDIEERVALLKQAMQLIMLSVSEFKPSSLSQ